MKPPVLILDLDGTLAETAGDLTASLNVVLTENGFQAISDEGVRSMVGLGAKVLLERGLVANGADLARIDIEPMYARFLSYYRQNIAVYSHVFPGVVEALDTFRANGWKLAICTNKVESLTFPLVEALDLAKYFDAIVCGDTFAHPKPDPAPLLGAISRCGADKNQAVMVGDSKTDIDAARAAKTPVVAVDFGYTPVPVAKLDPDKVISHFDALWDAVASLRKQQ